MSDCFNCFTDSSSTLLEGRFELVRLLGSGGFGKVFVAYDKDNNEKVAIKVEKRRTGRSSLEHEKECYDLLGRWAHFPKIKYFGRDQGCPLLVMDLLGPSLETILDKMGRKFSMKTVGMLGDQMIGALQYLHSRGFVHRDIKPDNFVMGVGHKVNRVFLVDFGLMKSYKNLETDVHNSLSFGNSPVGTAIYASINVCMGIEYSRRDDMESLGYTLLQLLKGSLPWSGIEFIFKQNRFHKIGLKKESIPIEKLCSDLPYEIEMMLFHIHTLEFREEPPYEYLRLLLSKLYNQNLQIFQYDWIILNDVIKKRATCTEDEITEAESIAEPAEITRIALPPLPFEFLPSD